MLAHRPPQVSSGTINAYSASSQQKTIMRSDTTKKRRPDHSGSKLLTTAENQLLFENLGQNRISLVAGIVQLLRANHGQWQHVHVGVVSLVKDYERKLYALILFDIYTGNKLWEQILYKNFTVKDYPKCRKLLSFESDDYVCGLNFSDETEAANFKHHLDKRHDAERGQKDPRGSIKASHHHQAPPPQPQSTPKQTYNQPASYDQKFQSPGFTGVGSTPHFSVSHNTAPTPPPTKDKKKQKEQKKKKTKISKEDIGYPTNFEHKAHLGWDTDGGFSQHTSAEPMDESVRKLLQVAGQNPDIMSHEELSFASKFIKDYKETAVAPPIPQSTYPQSTLSRNNGRSQGFSMAPMTHQQPTPQIQQQQQHVPAATHYGTGPTTQVYHYQTQQHSYPSNDHVVMPPPPPGRDSSIYTPQRQQQQQPVRPPPIERPSAPVYQDKPSYERSYQPPVISNAPPPPPPMTAKTTTTVQINHPPAPQQSRPGPPPPPPPPTQTAKPAAAKSSANAPPAPPPPPMLNTVAATPSSNGSASLPPAQDGRANLLAQIQQGAKLKHVTAPVEKSGFAKGEAKGNDRDQMMEQIKQGAQLKHVDATEVENRKSVPNVQEIGGIAGALARALEERRKNMNVSDESDNDEDNDSEWDAD